MSDLILDPNNANTGTVRGSGMVERSLQQYGAGRSILASSDGVVLAGNKTLERAQELGIPIQEIESDGTTLYVIRRTDLAYDDPRNSLFKEYVRLLRGLRPKVFVMENVSGMIKGKMKLVFAEILRELKASGYQVSARLLNVMYFHVPQSRQRMIFIGVRDDLGIEPSHPTAKGGIMNGSDVVPELSGTRFMTWRIKGGKDTLRPLGAIPTGITRSGISLEGRKTYRNPKGVQLFFSFPLKFEIIGTENQQLDCIGNSVPPLFMRAIAEHIDAYILQSSGTESQAQVAD